MAGEPSKEDMIQNVLSSYQVALNDKGIDEDYLAQKASEALNATVSKTVKLKGCVWPMWPAPGDAKSKPPRQRANAILISMC